MGRGGPMGRGGLKAWLDRFVEMRTLLFVLLAIATVWGIVRLAGEVAEGETAGFDRALLLGLRNPADLSDPIGPPWVEEMARDVTALGGVTVLTFLTLSLAGYLWLQGNRRSVLLLLLSIGGGRILSAVLKLHFDRPRPDLVPHGSFVVSTSFPSTHSMMAAIVYFTLAILFARVQERRILKIYAIVLAAILAVSIGISRVYLGVHWPTDVVAGWAVGILWAAATFVVAQWLQRRGAVEPQKDDRGADLSGGPREGPGTRR